MLKKLTSIVFIVFMVGCQTTDPWIQKNSNEVVEKKEVTENYVELFRPILYRGSFIYARDFDKSNNHIYIYKKDKYTVEKGDTLISISRKILGNENLWNDIYNKNKDILFSPHIIEIGQELYI